MVNLVTPRPAKVGDKPRNDELAGAETVFMVERNMCNAVMRGIVVPPGSYSAMPVNHASTGAGYTLLSGLCLGKRCAFFVPCAKPT